MANKGEIRNLILEQVDWNPNQSTDFKSKVDRLINRAYQAMSLEAPFLFFEEEARIVVAPDVGNSLTNLLMRMCSRELTLPLQVLMWLGSLTERGTAAASR